MSDALIRMWAETWKRAGPELEAIRRRELEEMTEDDVRAYVRAIFTGPYPFDAPPRQGSGLVEQQRWFAKIRQMS